jgi:DNA replication licensing factor MCM2
MCENNRSSVVVEFPILASKEQVLAFFLPDATLEMLAIFDEVATQLVLSIFPSYNRVTTDIHVRISDLPLVEDLRTFRSVHIGIIISEVYVMGSFTGTCCKNLVNGVTGYRLETV